MASVSAGQTMGKIGATLLSALAALAHLPPARLGLSVINSCASGRQPFDVARSVAVDVHAFGLPEELSLRKPSTKAAIKWSARRSEDHISSLPSSMACASSVIWKAKTWTSSPVTLRATSNG